ncbi:uncharacterized protein LOC144601581 [Rhinoraja longicauda]
MAIKMMSLQSMCWLIACLAIQPSAATSKVDCKWGWDGVTCTETNHDYVEDIATWISARYKIIIGVVVGVVGGIIVVALLVWCCCWALNRPTPRQRAVVNTTAATVLPMGYGQPVLMYPGFQGYQPAPLQLSPAQLAMNATPCSYAYPQAGQAQPPPYNQAAFGEQPSQVPTGGMNDNPEFVNTAQTKI